MAKRKKIEVVLPVRLSDMIEKSREMTKDEFARFYIGSDFLVSTSAQTADSINMGLKTLTKQDVFSEDKEKEQFVYELPWEHIDLSGPKYGNKLWVGRYSNPPIVLAIANPNISRLQGYFMKARGELSFTDADSSNGTFIDKEKLTPLEKAVLQEGSILHFGKTDIHLIFYTPQGVINYLRSQWHKGK